MRQPSEPSTLAAPSRLRALYARHGLTASVVVLCVLFCAALWTSLFVLAGRERERIIESKRQENSNLARVFEEHVARTVRAAEITLREITSEYQRRGGKFDLIRYVRDHRIELDPYNFLSFIDKDGNLIAASYPLPEPMNYRQYDSFQYQSRARPDTPQPYLSAPRIGTYSRKLTMFLSMPLNDAGESFSGIALVGMDPSYFSKIYADLDLGKDAAVTLLRRDGVVLARARDSGVEQPIGQSMAGTNLFTRLLPAADHGSFTGAGTVDGVVRINSYRALKNRPLVVLIGTSQAVALAVHEDRISIYLQVAAASTAMILALGVFALVQIRRKVNTNAALQRERDFATKLIDTTPAIMVLLDLEGRIKHVNPYFEKLSGYRLDEIRGREWFATLLPERDRERIRALFRIAAHEMPTRGNINPIVTRSGEEREIEWNDQAMRDDKGKVIGVLAIGQDVTERVALQTIERESRRRLQSILDSMFAFVGLFTPEGIVTEANRAPLAAAGLKREDVIGKPFWETYWWTYSPQGQAQVRDALQRAAQGETVRDDFRVRLAENVFITIDATFGPVRDEKGQVAQIVGSGVDITTHRQVEMAVRESAAKLNEAQRIALIGSWELNLVNGDLTWSDEIFRIFEIDKAKFSATYEAFLNAIHPEDREAVNAAYTRSLETREPYHITHRLRVADGRIKYVHERCESEFDAEGRPLRSVGTVQDVTEKTLAELQIHRLNAELEQRVLERTANLEAANKELETFSYSVAHDLKGPLRGIDGYSLLLLEDYSAKLDDTGRQFLANVRAAALQMNELIDDLLAYSRLERRDMQAGKVDPQELIETLLAEYADEIRTRGVVVTMAVSCRSVSADRDGLAMALRNFLENALKFTRDVAKPAIEIGGRDTGAMCIFSVRDNGIGFDMKHHEQIFTIFERLHRMEDYPGTGVGLAIVKKAMERMGGRAWAESKPGKGATFYLEIPE